MRSLRGIFLVLIASLLGKQERVAAQGTQEGNDSLFKIVKSFVNAQNSDGLYALLNDDFKAKLSKDQFTGVLTNNLYPLGAIGETMFLSYSNGTSSYKAVCPNAVLEFRIASDKSGKISGLRFLPYKEPVAAKSYTVGGNNPMKTTLDKHVDTIARKYINKVNTVGLCIGILKDGRMTTYGYGTTAKGNDPIPGADAIFEIGSISKTFTATLLAYYVTERKVALTDPITRYLPDSVAVNKELKKVTLQMLANHTSGMEQIPGNLLTDATDMANPYKYYDKAKLYAYLKSCKLQSAPGEKYAYSNLAAGLLGTILEGVSGKSYGQMIEEIICKPLGMGNTMQHPDAQQKEKQVNVHNEKGEQVIMWDMDALAGAGAIRSSVHDMLLYAQAQIKKEKTDLSKAMDLTHAITYDKDMVVALGWHGAKPGDTWLWHNGGTGGCSSYMAFDSAKNVAVVILSNTAESTDATGEMIMGLLRRD